MNRWYNWIIAIQTNHHTFFYCLLFHRTEFVNKNLNFTQIISVLVYFLHLVVYIFTDVNMLIEYHKWSSKSALNDEQLAFIFLLHKITTQTAAAANPISLCKHKIVCSCVIFFFVLIWSITECYCRTKRYLIEFPNDKHYIVYAPHFTVDATHMQTHTDNE